MKIWFSGSMICRRGCVGSVKSLWRVAVIPDSPIHYVHGWRYARGSFFEGYRDVRMQSYFGERACDVYASSKIAMLLLIVRHMTREYYSFYSQTFSSSSSASYRFSFLFRCCRDPTANPQTPLYSALSPSYCVMDIWKVEYRIYFLLSHHIRSM